VSGPAAPTFPVELDVIVEVARWGLSKRREDGSLDFISPLPCPFNYGSVPETLAADGDREDAVVLGPRLRAGTRLRTRVVGRVQFIDAGLLDAKWICAPANGSGAGQRGMSAADRARVALFFSVYSRAKRALNALRGLPGPTRYAGLELPPR
jgi:inorganic pyrophosphatase